MDISSVLNNISGPARIVFEPTINCNLRCPMCDRTHKKDYCKHKEEQLSHELIIKFLSELKELGVKHILLIGGGEPLMHPNILEYIKLVKSFNIYLHLWTNGTLITEKNADFLANHCDMITVSLDSPHPEVNDLLRGVSGSTIKTIKGIGLLRKYNPNLYLRIHSVLGGKNIPHLNDFIPLVKEYKLNEVGGAIINPFPFVPDDFLIPEDLRTNYLNYINDFCSQLSKENVKLAGCYNPISKNKIEELKKEFNQEATSLVHNTCLGLWSQATVRPNGDVSVCCFSYKPVLGNLHDQTFSEIWKSKKAEELRRIVSQGTYLDKPCVGCDLGNPIFTKLINREKNLDLFNEILISSR